MFVMSGRKLFCSCCREEVSLKLSSIKNYINSLEHKVSKDKEAKKNMRHRTIAQHLEVYESKAHPRDEILPDSQKFYRIKMVTAF